LVVAVFCTLKGLGFYVGSTAFYVEGFGLAPKWVVEGKAGDTCDWNELLKGFTF